MKGGEELVEYNVANEIAQSQVVWAILCILLAAYFIREMRKENQEHRDDSRIREKKLLDHLERSNESQEKSIEALEQINSSLSDLRYKVDRMEKLFKYVDNK